MKRYLPRCLKRESVIFYQDKAPCHAAKTVQAHLAAIFPRFIPNDRMPPNSPDLNPLDYSIWSLLKQRLIKYGLITDFEKLKKILKKEWLLIPQEAIRSAVDVWQFRVRGVVGASGTISTMVSFFPDIALNCPSFDVFGVFVSFDTENGN